MKLIIAGGRNYQLTEKDVRALNAIRHEVTEVVSGNATGADLGGEMWASDHGIPVKGFTPDWATHGKAAGPIRNAEMARYADAVALFPGGRGTASMLAEAKRAGIKIYDFTKQ